MRGLLGDPFTAYITTSDGGSHKVTGRDEYLGRLAAMDLASAQFTANLTQPPLMIDSATVLLMVEIRAAKAGRTLHNFAGHLLRVTDGTISHWWMVDAKPAESDQFWS